MRRAARRVWRPIGEFIFGCLVIVFFVFKFALIWVGAVIMIPFSIAGVAWLFVAHLIGGEFEMWEPIPFGLADRFDGFGSKLADWTMRVLGIADDPSS